METKEGGTRDKITVAMKRRAKSPQEMASRASSLELSDSESDNLHPKRPYSKPIPDILVKLVNNRYRQDISGPFTVHIEKVSSSSDIQGAIGVLKLEKTLLSHVPQLMNAAFDFKRAGHNKFSLTFPFGKQANAFVSEFWSFRADLFPGEVWVGYIPHYRITKQMVIRGVDDDSIDPEVIHKHVRPPYGWKGHWNGPIDVIRLRKRVPDDKSTTGFSLADTNLYIASFHNSVVPTSAILLGKSIFFTPFIQRVRRCANCQRFGHTAGLCKGASKKCYCESCGDLGHNKSDCTTAVVKCINCIRAKLTDINHKASDSGCPIFLRQKEIKKIMAALSLSPGEASDHLTAHGPLSDEPKHKGWNRLGDRPFPVLVEFFPDLPPSRIQDTASPKEKIFVFGGGSNR